MISAPTMMANTKAAQITTTSFTMTTAILAGPRATAQPRNAAGAAPFPAMMRRMDAPAQPAARSASSRARRT
jgi:hypothetical protein